MDEKYLAHARQYLAENVGPYRVPVYNARRNKLLKRNLVGLALVASTSFAFSEAKEAPKQQTIPPAQSSAPLGASDYLIVGGLALLVGASVLGSRPATPGTPEYVLEQRKEEVYRKGMQMPGVNRFLS